MIKTFICKLLWVTPESLQAILAALPQISKLLPSIFIEDPPQGCLQIMVGWHLFTKIAFL